MPKKKRNKRKEKFNVADPAFRTVKKPDPFIDTEEESTAVLDAVFGGKEPAVRVREAYKMGVADGQRLRATMSIYLAEFVAEALETVWSKRHNKAEKAYVSGFKNSIS